MRSDQLRKYRGISLTQQFKNVVGRMENSDYSNTLYEFSVEAQKDFHARRNGVKHHGHSRPSTSSSSGSSEPETEAQPPPSVVTPPASLVQATSHRSANSEDENTDLENNVIPEKSVGRESTTLEATSAPTSKPTSFCMVQRPHQSHQYIREGKGKRLYREDEPECSELCQCGANETLTCNTKCVQLLPCKTDFAFYNHAAPAYQAYRGRCLCYSGRFICMRPAPEAYNIPHGVFMFLGYSKDDEDLLKDHNNQTVIDAVSSLDSFMREEVNNQTICTLFLYNITKENVIAVARLLTDSTPSNNLTEAENLQHLIRIKGQRLMSKDIEVRGLLFHIFVHKSLFV
ncbi:hypothetical protein QAD02_006891 [Eretmocerus hayati]|uniref:Uncharacterized protein n=1 Tax=Eretmocerus hayati TaxID=131215 RepID=A0ACC2N237_9HYME|nr:hypothetical protein QAD02_006891 [Eretmocerus hayati]